MGTHTGNIQLLNSHYTCSPITLVTIDEIVYGLYPVYVTPLFPGVVYSASSHLSIYGSSAVIYNISSKSQGMKMCFDPSLDKEEKA